MDFKQIEAFASVARYKSFSKAAEAVYLSQPTISAHINALENELGIVLFDRSGREVQLTPAGMVFLDYALNLLDTRNEAVQSLTEFYNKIEGKIYISCSTTPLRSVLPGVLRSFSEKFPDVKYEICEMSSGKVYESLLRFDAEIGITGKMAADPRLSFFEYCDDDLVLVVPNNERFRGMKGNSIEFSEAAHERFILREEGSATRDLFLSAIARKGYNREKLNVLCEVNSMDAVIQLVKSGLGVTVISRGAVREYIDFNAVRMFNIKDLSLKRKIYFVRYGRRALSPAAKMFLDFALSGESHEAPSD